MRENVSRETFFIPFHMKQHQKQGERNKTGATALTFASSYGTPEMVQLLIDNGAQTDIRDNDGLLPVDHAKQKGNKEIEGLLSK